MMPPNRSTAISLAGEENAKPSIRFCSKLPISAVVDPTGQPVEGVQVSAGPNFRDSRGSGDLAQWRLRGFPQELTDGSP